jgi:hypothetical protein
MRTVILLVCAAVLCGCGGSPFSTNDPQPDSGSTEGACCGDDATPPPEASDAGGEDADSRPCTACHDAAPEAASEAGTPDGGNEASASEGGTGEGGVDEGGVPEAGAPEAGAPEGGPEAGGQDAAPEAGCTTGALSCNGNQPVVCQGGTFVNNGGVCGYGCNAATGLCDCSAGSRFTQSACDGGACSGGIYVTDAQTGLTWFYYNTGAYQTDLQMAVVCAGIGNTVLPTEDQVLNLLVETPKQTPWSCARDIDTSFSGMSWVWTSTPCATNGYVEVNGFTGATQCLVGGASAIVNILCVQ